jgi:cytochrome c peroxidase
MPLMVRAQIGSIVVAAVTFTACGRPASSPASTAETKPSLPTVALEETGAFPLPAHVESADIASGKYTHDRLFTAGSDLFHAVFNGADGVGVAERPDGTKVNRFAPLGPGGPASQSCAECHNFPAGAAAGLAHSSVVRAPPKVPPPFDARAATSLFGDGILQLLAQEMTEELQSTRDAAIAAAKAAPGSPVTRELSSKGTAFGSITANVLATGQVSVDVSKLAGIDPDLVVRPMGWKGDSPLVRSITRGASAGGMGMQPEEAVWKRPGGDQLRDLDGDGVSRELSVGDVTAMTIYSAAQETPTELARLAALGYVQAPSAEGAARIERGRKLLADVGCASCHRPEMPLINTRFEEPTARGNGNYYDQALAKLDTNYDPKRPAAFDILKDAQPPRAEARDGGGAIIRLYGDLKRHAMGRLLADRTGPTDPSTASGDDLKYEGEAVKIPADVFLTAELWGVGNTGPWLHDNRAGTLREAILLHGEDEPPPVGQPGRSEAQESREAFKELAKTDQEALVAFLLSLRTFSPEPK